MFRHAALDGALSITRPTYFFMQDNAWGASLRGSALAAEVSANTEVAIKRNMLQSSPQSIIGRHFIGQN
jgi:hypothetical protein